MKLYIIQFKLARDLLSPERWGKRGTGYFRHNHILFYFTVL